MTKLALALLKILVFLFPSSLAFGSDTDIEPSTKQDNDNSVESCSTVKKNFENLKKKSFFIIRKSPTLTGISINDLINDGIINIQSEESVNSSWPFNTPLLERREMPHRFESIGSNERSSPLTITLGVSERRHSNGVPFTLTAIDSSCRTISIEPIEREEVVDLLIKKGALMPEEITSDDDLLDLLRENSYGIILTEDEVLFTSHK